jgi:hypothetical protein
MVAVMVILLMILIYGKGPVLADDGFFLFQRLIAGSLTVMAGVARGGT